MVMMSLAPVAPTGWPRLIPDGRSGAADNNDVSHTPCPPDVVLPSAVPGNPSGKVFFHGPPY
jgi:hypothetical protein